jgi:hypothetical protein
MRTSPTYIRWRSFFSILNLDWSALAVKRTIRTSLTDICWRGFFSIPNLETGLVNSCYNRTNKNKPLLLSPEGIDGLYNVHGKDLVDDPVKDGDEEEDEEGLDDQYLAKTWYTILAKPGYMILSKIGMRRGYMTCTWQRQGTRYCQRWG